MSPTGLERCETCHEGFYQSEYAQVKCLPCPDGSTTLRRGARGKQHCKGRTFPRISMVFIAQRILYVLAYMLGRLALLLAFMDE